MEGNSGLKSAIIVTDALMAEYTWNFVIWISKK